MTDLPGTADCPCGGGRYADCCAPFLRRETWPPTAEALMRSRYAAFAVADAEYLLRTWHPRTRPESLELDDRRWDGLEIVERTDGAEDDLMGIVGFVARWSDRGRRGTLVERSAFVRRGGRWVYLAATPESE
ncbi:MAG: YchJ family metal-binding protein [Micropruina sp.]|uniref:YchJ family protein n=1 Tax=Micropruina sp. TaxID=2737536 RepID=UPI0039E37F2F